ncbi:MAG: TadE/TadG family type IV pilus assembly protein [Boseongicola sp.]
MKIQSSKLKKRFGVFFSDETGTTLVEFAICVSLFLLILFAVIDFSRLGYNWVVAEKAMQRAVRIAAVRPPVCAGVPSYHARDSGASTTYGAGTLCSTDGGVCEQVDVQCLLSNPDGGNPDSQNTADEMWAALQDLMPEGTDRPNILLQYNYDRRLGFIGGPYVPLITARIVGSANGNNFNELMFEFVTPLSSLAAAAGAANASSTLPDGPGCTGCIPFPGISVTLPAEDMNQGMNG